MSTIKDVLDIPRGFCNKNRDWRLYKEIQICIYDADHNCVLDEIKWWDKIEDKKMTQCGIISVE